MESNSQTAPPRIQSHNGNLLSCDSNNPLEKVRGFFGFRCSSRDTARLVPWLCGFAILLKGFGSDILLGAPITRLIELAVCRQYLSIHNPDLVGKDGYVDEVHCKVDDIQVEMALILGVVGLLSALVELLVSVPLGIVADRRGRRFALTLNVVGGLCYYLWVLIVCIFYKFFPSRLLAACSLFYAIGGGPHMFSAFILAMIADVTSEKQRTRHFYVVQSIVQIVQLISPATGSLFLGIGLWIPFYVGLSAMVVLIGVVLVIPETAALRNPVSLPTEQDPLLDCLASSPSVSTVAPGETERTIFTNTHEAPPLHSKPLRSAQFLDLALHQPIIPLSLATFFFSNLCRGSFSLLLQYVSKRYGWSLSQAGYLISLKALSSTILFLFILPYLTHSLTTSWGLSTQNANLLVAKISICLLASGCLLIGLAATVPLMIIALFIMSLGFGFGTLVQSIVTSIVRKDQVARLYSTISAAETAGTLIGQPLLALGLAAGFRLGGLAFGLPWFMCVVFYAIAALPVWWMTA